MLAATVDQLLSNPDTGVVSPTLRPMAAALKSMKRANSGLTWLNQEHVTRFLAELATTESITHESLDSLPPHATRDYVRGLLVEYAALPRRDERLARYLSWSEQAIKRVADGSNRDIMRRFIRWHIVRRMNAMDQVSEGTFLRSKQTTTVAINFLNWIGERGTVLEHVTQSDLDAWQAEGPSTREFAARFLSWAEKSRLAPLGLALTPHRRGTSPKLAASEQTTVIQAITRTEHLNPRDRFAAILVLVFGQRVEDATRLTWKDAEISDGKVLLKLGLTPLELPPPLDGPLRDLLAQEASTAAHPNSQWIFPGQQPGGHITAATLRHRLKCFFSTRAARLGALQELSKTTPVPILAEVLGYSPATIELHATASASTYARYIGAVLNEKA